MYTSLHVIICLEQWGGGDNIKLVRFMHTSVTHEADDTKK